MKIKSKSIPYSENIIFSDIVHDCDLYQFSTSFSKSCGAGEYLSGAVRMQKTVNLKNNLYQTYNNVFWITFPDDSMVIGFRNIFLPIPVKIKYKTQDKSKILPKDIVFMSKKLIEHLDRFPVMFTQRGFFPNNQADFYQITGSEITKQPCDFPWWLVMFGHTSDFYDKFEGILKKLAIAHGITDHLGVYIKGRKCLGNNKLSGLVVEIDSFDKSYPVVTDEIIKMGKNIITILDAGDFIQVENQICQQYQPGKTKIFRSTIHRYNYKVKEETNHTKFTTIKELFEINQSLEF